MISRTLPCLGIVFAAALAQYGQTEGHPSYYPAFCPAAGDGAGVRSIMVFPVAGSAVTIAFPFEFPLSNVVYGDRGNTLYATSFSSDPVSRKLPIYKVTLEPFRETTLVTIPVIPYDSFAVTPGEDQVVVSGRLTEQENRSTCGIFDIRIADGAITKILGYPCGAAGASSVQGEGWLNLSLSPDGRRAVALHEHNLEVIDIHDGSTRLIARGFVKAGWSPDGRWIAAIENGGRWRTVLFDTSRFIRRRVLPASEAEWSPDSRYLLRVAGSCGVEEAGTIEVLNVDTGKWSAIPSSRCKVYMRTTGWVNAAVFPNSGHN
jgi:hypothetical protein